MYSIPRRTCMACLKIPHCKVRAGMEKAKRFLYWTTHENGKTRYIRASHWITGLASLASVGRMVPAWAGPRSSAGAGRRVVAARRNRFLPSGGSSSFGLDVAGEPYPFALPVTINLATLPSWRTRATVLQSKKTCLALSSTPGQTGHHGSRESCWRGGSGKDDFD